MGTVQLGRPDGDIDIESEDFRENDKHAPTYPIVECFGPVLQGEGALIGVQTDFIRFAGCEFRCSWCDSPNAVLPERIKVSSKRLSLDELLNQVVALNSGAQWLTLSGGNPVLFNCAPIIDWALSVGKKVAIETQGSYYSPWMRKLTLATISPKPPSSGMVPKFNYAAFTACMALSKDIPVALKIPIADEEDLAWAKILLTSFGKHDNVTSFVQPVRSIAVQESLLYDESTTTQLLMLSWLAELVMKDPDLAHVRVLPQLHALIGMR